MGFRRLTAVVLVAALLASCAAEPPKSSPTSALPALAAATSPAAALATSTPLPAATPTSAPLAKAPEWGALQAKLLASKANRFRQEVTMQLAMGGQQSDFNSVVEGFAAGGNLQFRATIKIGGRPDQVTETLYYEGKQYALQPDGKWLSAMVYDANQATKVRLGALASWQAGWLTLAPKGKGEARGAVCDVLALDLNPQALQEATGGLAGPTVSSSQAELCVGSVDQLARRFALQVRSTDGKGGTATFSSQLELWDFDNPALVVALPANAGPLAIAATASTSFGTAAGAVATPTSPPQPANTPLPPPPTATRANTPVPVPPTATRTSTPVPPPPTATPVPPAWSSQPSYTGDQCNPAAGRVCIQWSDGYKLLVNDVVVSQGDGEPYEGKPVRIAYGAKADYHHESARP